MRLETARLTPLLDAVDAQARIVDDHLCAPARWRGRLRREITRHADRPEERRHIAAAFNALVERARCSSLPPLNAELLIELQHHAARGRGLRRRGVRVGRFRDFPEPAQLRGLLDDLFAETNALDHPALRAAVIHLRLVLIHPFSDGNGRLARLMASLCMLQGGYKSTLLTIVEQQVAPAYCSYGRMLAQLQSGEVDLTDAVAALLEALLARSKWLYKLRLDYLDREFRRDANNRDNLLPAWTRSLNPADRSALLEQLARVQDEVRDLSSNGSYEHTMPPP